MSDAPPSELAYRLRQQQLLSEFGLYALKCHDVDQLMARATEVAARGLNTRFAKVLEYRAEHDDLLVRAGVGWREGVVGQATIGADLESPAGYALKTGEPVISKDLGSEERFRIPPLLIEHGISSVINVLVPGGGFRGVLEVDSSNGNQFSDADIAFLKGFAQWLGVAIERQEADTELRELHEAVRRSEEEFRVLFETAPVGQAQIDPATGRLARVNAALCAMTGYAEAELLALTYRDITHPHDRAADEAGLRRLLSDVATVFETEKRYVRKDGSEFWASTTVSLIRDPNAEPLRMSAIIQDITRRKVAEAALAQTTEALRVAEERQRVAIEAGAIGIWEMLPKSGELLWDARAKELFGLPAAAELSYERALHGIHPEDRARVQEAIDAALDPHRAGDYDIDFRTIGLADGIERWVRAKGRAVFQGDRPLRFVGILIDIGDRKQVEGLLREKIEHQDMLMREVSHRFKNNLTLVAALLGLQMRSVNDAEVRQAITEAQTRIATVAQVHDQLWRQEQVDRVDLAAFLSSLCAKLQETAPQHRLICEAAPVVVPTDRAVPVGLIVNEMVTNAFKHAYPGGAGGEVRVSVSTTGRGIRLEVADRGVGLGKEANFFAQGKSLGARLISGLVRQLGAKLEFASSRGGASFVVEMPRESI